MGKIISNVAEGLNPVKVVLSIITLAMATLAIGMFITLS